MDGYKDLHMSRLIKLFLTIILLLTLHSQGLAQWTQDFSRQMEIPNIITLESSESHLYALSDSEGLAVFRAHSDSLQYLYTSTGMQQRGNRMDSDIRFAYLYGDTRRLTVIEPTSVLGVYSSTVLPERPRSVKRVGNYLYMAMGSGGLGSLSLESPESVDSDVRLIDESRFSGSQVQYLATDRNRILYVLSGNRYVDIFTISSGDDESVAEHEERAELDRDAEKIFLTSDELIGADRSGNIFLISSGGSTSEIGSVGSSIRDLRIWNEQLVVRTNDGELWIGSMDGEIALWKDDGEAGNFFTVTEDQLWVSERGRLAPVVSREGMANGSGESNGENRLVLKEIPDITIPFPRPLLLPLELEYEFDGDVSLTFDAPFSNARIRGNTLLWQPSATQTGRHRVEVIATSPDGQSDRQTFTVDLRPFNSPPRFTSVRPVSIPVGESFQLDIRAVDPDGVNPNLIRYLGVDLPEGARLNEKTGLFTWNPNVRQVGEHTFQVVATDQYGAATSQDFEIRVIEIEEAEEATEEQDN